MIYTVGYTENYLKCFKEQGFLKKMGKNESYAGGSVWKTREEAEKYCEENCDKGYSVFGVIADWDKDTEPSSSKDYNNLLRDSELVIL